MFAKCFLVRKNEGSFIVYYKWLQAAPFLWMLHHLKRESCYLLVQYTYTCCSHIKLSGCRFYCSDFFVPLTDCLFVNWNRFLLPQEPATVVCVLYWSVWNVGTWQLRDGCVPIVWACTVLSVCDHITFDTSGQFSSFSAQISTIPILSTLYFSCFKDHIKIYPGIPKNITFLFSVCLYCVQV